MYCTAYVTEDQFVPLQTSMEVCKSSADPCGIPKILLIPVVVCIPVTGY